MADLKTLPDVRYASSHLELIRFISSSRTHGGLMNVIEYGDPHWQLSLTTAPLTYSDGAMVDAWFQSLRGGIIPVLAKAPHYCTPRALIHNRGAEAQSGTIVNISSVTRIRFQIGAVASGFALSAGDFVTISQGERYHLGRVTKGFGVGAIPTVEIEPPLPSSFTAGATVYFDRATLVMRPLWDAYEPWSREGKTVSMKFMETFYKEAGA